MRFDYATKWGDSGTFCFLADGPIVLVRALGRRTDVSPALDLTLAVFPLTRGGWRPVYERHVFYLARLGGECAQILEVPFGKSDRVSVFLMNVPEVVLNTLWRAGDQLVEMAAQSTPPVSRG